MRLLALLLAARTSALRPIAGLHRAAPAPAVSPAVARSPTTLYPGTWAGIAAVPAAGAARAERLDPRAPAAAAASALLLAACVSRAPSVTRSRAPQQRDVRRARPAKMALEAFELMPVLECLKESDAAKMQACMDILEPYLAVGEGSVKLSDSFIDGLTGGAFGAIGTLFFILRKKEEVKTKLKCVYCDGTGQIDCGRCLKTGKVSAASPGAHKLMACPSCDPTTGTVVCVNCQGSGRTLPEDIFQRLGDEEEGFTEEDYIGLFDEQLEKKKDTTKVLVEQIDK